MDSETKEQLREWLVRNLEPVYDKSLIKNASFHYYHSVNEWMINCEFVL